MKKTFLPITKLTFGKPLIRKNEKCQAIQALKLKTEKKDKKPPPHIKLIQ